MLFVAMLNVLGGNTPIARNRLSGVFKIDFDKFRYADSTLNMGKPLLLKVKAAKVLGFQLTVLL